MKKAIAVSLVAGIILLIISVGMLYLSVYALPGLAKEYFSPVFRSSGKTDWMYYTHPFLLSFALKWFWERYKSLFRGPVMLRAIEVALVYSIVAMIPVLWITFSAIDVSLQIALTWFGYGFVQAFVAGIVFAKLNP